jgi:putative ABC transport system substrate-binding protein
MKRRDFITLLGGSAVVWPIAARAQQGQRARRIGMLASGTENDQASQAYIGAFRDGLAKLGWDEAHNLRIDLRFSRDVERIRANAAELVSLAPDVIVTTTDAATRAVQQQTQTIPIVITGVGDPVASGLVKSFARPEGNTTGVTSRLSSIGGKWLELLKEAAPRVARIALIYNAQATPEVLYFPSIEEAARLFAVTVIKTPYRDTLDLVRGIDAFASEPNGGLIVLPPRPGDADRGTILRLAAQHRLPTIYQDRALAAEGGLMAYGSDAADIYRRASYIVDRILRGTKVAELPVEFATKFELVINLKAAKAIGLTIPEAFLLRADELFE